MGDKTKRGIRYRMDHSLNARFTFHFSFFALALIVLTILVVSINGFSLILHHSSEVNETVNAITYDSYDANKLYEAYKNREVTDYIKEKEHDIIALQKSLDDGDVAFLHVVIPVAREETTYHLLDSSFESEADMDYFYSEKRTHTTATDKFRDIFQKEQTDKYYYGSDGTFSQIFPDSYYGILLTTFREMKTSDGHRMLLCSSIKMSSIVIREMKFLLFVLLMELLLAAVLCVFFMRMMRVRIVKPIENISEGARNFISKDDTIEKDEIIFDKIVINTEDEIRDLLNSLQMMETEIHDYIDKITVAAAERERINAEMNVAKHIQESLLPTDFPAFPDIKTLDLYATMRPAKQVGGDFYDFFRLDDTHVALVMADVSGKGLPASLFMAVSKSLLQSRALQGGTPSEILEDVNELLCDGNDASMFVTVWLGILDVTTGVMVTSSGGHEYPMLAHKGGKFQRVKDPHGLALGGMPASRYRNFDIQLQNGDRFYIYTDGIPESNNIHKELLGEERMIDILNKQLHKSPEDALIDIMSAVDKFAGDEPQFDDMTQLYFIYENKES